MSESTQTEKPFDCVEFKREAQLEIYEDIKDMNHEEEIEYFRRRAESGTFADLVAQLKQREQQTTPPDA